MLQMMLRTIDPCLKNFVFSLLKRCIFSEDKFEVVSGKYMYHLILDILLENHVYSHSEITCNPFKFLYLMKRIKMTMRDMLNW